MMRNLTLSIRTPVYSLHSARAAHVAVLSYVAISILAMLLVHAHMRIIRQTLNDTDFPPTTFEGLWLLAKTHTLWAGAFVVGLAGIIYLEKNQLLPLRTIRSLSSLGLLIAVLAAFTGPYTSSDIYNYLAVGSVAIVHGENPFATAPNEIDDPIVQSFPTPWNFRTSQYGPVLIGIAGIPWLVTNTADNLVLIFKTLLFLPYIALAWITYKTATALRHPLPVSVTAAFLGNPASLWLMLVDGHIDVVMILFVLASVFLLLHRHWAIAGVALGAAIATKVVPVILLPLFALYTWKQSRTGNRWRISFNFILGTLITIFLLYTPFLSTISIGSFTELFQPFYHPQFSGLLPSVAYWIAAAVIPNTDALHEFAVSYIAPVSRGALLAGLATVLLYSTKGIKTHTALLRSSILLFAIILTATHYIQPWYLLWLFPFALLIARSARTLYAATIYLTCITTAGIILPNLPGFAMSLAALVLPLWGTMLYMINVRFSITDFHVHPNVSNHKRVRRRD